MILVPLLLLASVVKSTASTLYQHEQSCVLCTLPSNVFQTVPKTVSISQVNGNNKISQLTGQLSRTSRDETIDASVDCSSNNLLTPSITTELVEEEVYENSMDYTLTTTDESITSSHTSEVEDLVSIYENSTNLVELNDTNLTLESFSVNLEDPMINISNKLGYNTSINDKETTGNDTLDQVHFMSFEEWKRQKENLTNDTSVYNETDKNTKPPVQNKSRLVDESKSAVPKFTNSSDNVGLTNFKNKFNYASIDCAATIAQTNNNAKGASAILLESKESYLLNKCSETDKFVIIELCQDILVEGVVIGNFEFFSSTFKDIKISVSERFPSTNWHKLGEFEARNIRDVQNFKIKNPFIWAKFLKIEILSHYGDEFYCPISVVRLHGKTMMDEVKEDTKPQQGTEASHTIVHALPLNASIGLDGNSIDKCQVILPHLQMADFLQVHNSNKDEFCEVSESIHTTISTQESFYKNIMKRLSLLESNATLSLLYVEEQSKLLSQAFSNLEKRQTGNIESLIHSFNSTIINQLTNFQTSYVHMHNEYAKLFKIQENSHRNLLVESKSKVSSLSRELIFQRGIVIFNSILILCLLVFVILTKLAYIDDTPSRLSKYHQAIPRTYTVGSFTKSIYKRSRKR